MTKVPPVLVTLSAVLSVMADLKRMAEEMVSKDIYVLIVNIVLFGRNCSKVISLILNHFIAGY
jgi:hypothetical protein